MNYINRLEKYISEIDYTEGDTSNIWDTLRKDFQSTETSLRGYGLSTISNTRIAFFRKFSRYMALPWRALRLVSSRMIKITNKSLSRLFLGDKGAAEKFGYSAYRISDYDKDDLADFKHRYGMYNIGFSHNTFKSFSYLKRLEQKVELESKLSIFEVGAGVFNFGHLLSLQLSQFEYVICDLPEMIASAFREINKHYIPNCSGNYEVFLPTEIDEFYKSGSSRRVLFITPEQLKSGCLGNDKRFDLFINHESFAEMSIDVVNSYLGYLPKLMKQGSCVFLVNRHTRPQAKTYEQFEGLSLQDVTCFSDYNLDFCTEILKEIDMFRAKIQVHQTLPNVLYIGETTE